jgi:hypothetical protein
MMSDILFKKMMSGVLHLSHEGERHSCYAHLVGMGNILLGGDSAG